MAVTQATRLGCGRDVDDVWEHIDEPPTEHEQTCPYCSEARANLSELSAATHDLTATDRDDPALAVPTAMLSTILEIVRTEVRRGRTIPLQRPPAPRADHRGSEQEQEWEPDLTVSEQVIATVVRETCDQNPLVEVRKVNVRTAPAPTPTSSSSGRADVVLDLGVTVSRTSSIPDLIAALRHDLTDAIGTQIGLGVAGIDVFVQDIHDA